MRYNDVRNNTNIVEDVLTKYQEAWAQRGGLVAENGLFRRWYHPRQDKVLTAEELSHSAWYEHTS